MKANNIVHIYASLETKCLVVRFFRLSLFIAVEMLLLTAYPSRIPLGHPQFIVDVHDAHLSHFLLLLFFVAFVVAFLKFCFCFIVVVVLFAFLSHFGVLCTMSPMSMNVHFWLSLHTEWHVQSRRYRILSSGMQDIKHLLAMSVIYAIGDRIRSKQF